MGDNESPDHVLGKALGLLSAIVLDNGRRSLSAIAEELRIPRATAHRTAQALQRDGYLIRSRRGYYHPGPALALPGRHSSPITLATGVARPILAQLAMQEDCLAHMGIFEQDMVTYLLKEGAGKDALFTRQNMQLEAYCSGLGKVLLAALDDSALDAYLADGPFVPLTPNTIVDPEALRAEIARVRLQGYGIDNCEASETLFCIAAPLFGEAGEVLAAISISLSTSAIVRSGWQRPLNRLRDAVSKISARMHGIQMVA